jgi:hypothetical protein
MPTDLDPAVSPRKRKAKAQAQTQITHAQVWVIIRLGMLGLLIEAGRQ